MSLKDCRCDTIKRYEDDGWRCMVCYRKFWPDPQESRISDWVEHETDDRPASLPTRFFDRFMEDLNRDPLVPTQNENLNEFLMADIPRYPWWRAGLVAHAIDQIPAEKVKEAMQKMWDSLAGTGRQDID